MSYGSAKKGIGQIFTAEILQLLSAIFILIGSVMAVVGVAAVVGGGMLESDVAVGGGVVGGIAGLALSGLGGIFSLVGFILYIVGVGNAAKDEESFKKAMLFLVVGLVCSVVSAFTGTVANGILKDILTILGDVFQLISAIYVINGIISLAGKVGNVAIEHKGRHTLKTLVIVIVISIVATLISLITSTVAAVVAGILGIVVAVMSIIKYFIYLSLLNGARKMFD